MKEHNSFLLLIIGIIFQSCVCIHSGLNNSDFINLFKTTDTLSFYNSYKKIPIIEDKIVLKYLCPVSNECLKNLTNDRYLVYLPISKTNRGNYWLISYSVTDGYENKDYIASFSKKEQKIISILLVKQYIGDQFLVNCNINNKNNIINIYYYQKDIENENELHTVEETYSLSFDFRLISTYPPKIIIDDIKPVKIVVKPIE